MNSNLENAENALVNASDELRKALKNASAVESIVLLPLIKDVNETRNQVGNLLAARLAKKIKI